MTNEVIEAEVVGREVVPAQPMALFGTTDPAEHIERAVAHAKALKNVVEQRGLIADIQGKKYVLYDGWALLASMVGASIVEDWTRPLENGWEARMLVMRNGNIIGAAENMCTRDEKRWAKADEYAIRSMAQTRAGGKAARTCLGFIVQLAGYEATPFDEMPQHGMEVGANRPHQPSTPPPSCPEHGTKFMQLVKAGKSKKTGNDYDAFWSCDKTCNNGKGYDGKPNGKSYSKDAAAHIADLQLARGDAEPPNAATFDDLPAE